MGRDQLQPPTLTPPHSKHKQGSTFPSAAHPNSSASAQTPSATTPHNQAQIFPLVSPHIVDMALPRQVTGSGDQLTLPPPTQ